MKKIFSGIYIIFALISGPMAIPVTLHAATNGTSGTNGTETNNYLGSFYDQEKDAAERAKKIKPPNPVWTTIKIILYTGLFGVAAYFVVRFVVAKGALPATEDGKLVEIIMTKQAGMGSYLQIVKVGAAYYLLSLSGEGLRYIDKIQDKETIDFIELNKDKMKPKENKFFDFLSYLPLSKKTDKMEFLKNQKDRLRKM